MVYLMLVLKDADRKAESIPVHTYQGQTEKQQLEYKDPTYTGLAHLGHISETKNIGLTTY